MSDCDQIHPELVMAHNSLNVKGRAVGAASSLRITPTNSPGLRPPRTPNKSPQHQATLSLQTVIGTTTTTPHGFSSHDQSKSFAICAGSAAILAELDEAGNVNQRFFRARPSASSVHPVTSFYHQSTPPSTPDTRARPLSGVKPTAHSAIPNGSPANELAESNSSRAWSSRERVKAVTSVSISPNGRFLAVGEVCGAKSHLTNSTRFTDFLLDWIWAQSLDLLNRKRRPFRRSTVNPY